MYFPVPYVYGCMEQTDSPTECLSLQTGRIVKVMIVLRFGTTVIASCIREHSAQLGGSGLPDTRD
jgi:hypothetical protein